MIDITPQRKPGETFEEYRLRRATGNRAVKEYLRGRVVWQSIRPVMKEGKVVGYTSNTYRKGNDVS